MKDDMMEFRDAFFEEAAEHVAKAENELLRLDTGAVDAEEMNAIFRAVHSVKGLAATLGFNEVAAFTHEFESVLDRLRGGRMLPTPELAQLLFRANDMLRDLLAASRADAPTSVDPAAVTAALLSVLENPSAAIPVTPAPAAAAATPSTPSTPPTPPTPATLSIRDVTDDPSRAGVAMNAAPLRAPAEGKAAHAPESASIRVPTGKVDALVDLVGEMVISQAMLHEIVATFDMSRLRQLQEALASLDRSTRELQERVMSVRMLPVSTVFSRFPRLVRDVATKLGKKVKLEMVGAETELDKGMMERIGDPLTHLVRNAMDHGLETPEDRVAAGKGDTGTVLLRAFHEGGNVIIQIDDDGRGLNTACIRQKAVERGLVQPDDTLDDAAIHQLIFAPGFSTADQVSDLSGRGVGMDVVKRNVEALNGSVTLTSQPARGSRVRIRLPLTLAILDGIIVSVGGESYVLPLLSVVESLRPRPRDVRSIRNGGEVLVVRGETIPFLRLHEVFGLEDAITEPSLGIVVIVETDGRHFGLLVDDVVGQQQVVIKNLEANYRRVEAIMGATILGDGRVSLIADIQELFRYTSRRAPASPAVLAGSDTCHTP